MKAIILTLSTLLFTLEAGAWGRQGHHIIGETAALILSTHSNGKFLKAHSYDMGYYSNVPDLVWKTPETYQQEFYNHFLDIEIFEREFKSKNVSDLESYSLSRNDFDKKFPGIKNVAGRSFWRIQEFVEALNGVTNQLKESSKKIDVNKSNKEEIKQHQKLQQKWLMLAGPLGHYVGDLAQPLHVTENYDGQLTGQKGVHEFYEENCVDELQPKLSYEVAELSKKKWPAFTERNKTKSVVELIYSFAKNSHGQLNNLLAMDKKIGRSDVKNAARHYHDMILNQLVEASLTLAEINRRYLGWQFIDKKFYFFGSHPDYIKPGKIAF